jgi:hypothetical protein
MPEEGLYISFWTEQAWTTEDIVTLTGSVGSVYDALLAVRLRDRLAQRQIAQSEGYYRALLRSWEKYVDHPFMHEWIHLWERALRKGIPPFLPSPLPLPGQQPWGGYYQPQFLTGSEILRSLRTYAEESDRCRLHAARFASPGGFSFTGIGEIVREFRELIKDVWYRNRQEKELGRLEIIEKCLRLRRDYQNDFVAPPTAPEPTLVETIDSAVSRIERMERDGKLLPVAENMDRVPR